MYIVGKADFLCMWSWKNCWFPILIKIVTINAIFLVKWIIKNEGLVALYWSLKNQKFSWLFRMTTFQIIELALLVAMYLIDQLNIWPFKVGHEKWQCMQTKPSLSCVISGNNHTFLRWQDESDSYPSCCSDCPAWLSLCDTCLYKIFGEPRSAQTGVIEWAA